MYNNSDFEWKISNPEGGYFAIADIEKIISKIPMKYFFLSDS